MMCRSSIITILLLAVVTTTFAQKGLTDKQVATVIASAKDKLNVSDDYLKNYRISYSYYDETSKSQLVYLQQTFHGVDIYNALVAVAIKDNNVITPGIQEMQFNKESAAKKEYKPRIAAFAALKTAAAHLNLTVDKSFALPLQQSADARHLVFDKMGIAFNNIQADLRWVIDAYNDLHLTWQITIDESDKVKLWQVDVDALNNTVINKRDLTTSCSWNAVNVKKLPCYDPTGYSDKDNSDGLMDIKSVNSASYRVIPYPYMDPDHASATVVSNPWTIFPNTDATTLKWNDNGTTTFDSTRGNNVFARSDLKSINALGFGAKSKTPAPDLTFDYTPDFNKQPTDSINLRAGISNLFYWNNLMHDFSYQYGFNELAGNFQYTNLSRGGVGNDFVYADAADGASLQDTIHINNANFATPTDGSSGRMQMYLWSASFFKILNVNSPSGYNGYKTAAESKFSINNKLEYTHPVTADVVYYRDLENFDTHLACGTPSNAAQLAGKIAYIDRGSCNFTVKVKNAQNAGAVGVIVGDNTVGSTSLIVMGGSDNTITIPAISISYVEAQNMKSYLDNGITVNVTLNAVLIDGSLDNAVVSHEYTHGISTRLVGGPNNASCLANGEQMGEGWSDYFALMMTTDWSTAASTDGSNLRPIGNYALGLTSDYGGIRDYPYTTDISIDPWTYDSLRTQSFAEYNAANNLTWGAIYKTGELWCSTLWDMTWDLVQSYGINTTFWDASKPGGNTIAMQLVMQGLKLTACSPGCMDARDGILKADTLLYGGKYSPIIWQAFARRGMGYSAKENSTAKIKDGVAAYDLPTVLPLTWGSFTAEKVNQTAHLSWTTLSENNTASFSIERSVGNNVFEQIGIVSASGNSNTYNFSDINPQQGTNIYRIKVTDKDGKTSYSVNRSLSFDDIKTLVKITPNPAKDKINVYLQNNTGVADVQLYNSTGQRLLQTTISGNTGNINVASLSSGVYYLRIMYNNTTTQQKIIIQK